MIYSVWNGERRLYDYYERALEINGKNPDAAHLPKGGTVASTHASYKLPSGAHKIGSGDVAKGMIADFNGSGALGGFEAVGPVGIVVIGFVLWRLMK